MRVASRFFRSVYGRAGEFTTETLRHKEVRFPLCLCGSVVKFGLAGKREAGLASGLFTNCFTAYGLAVRKNRFPVAAEVECGLVAPVTVVHGPVRDGADSRRPTPFQLINTLPGVAGSGPMVS